MKKLPLSVVALGIVLFCDSAIIISHIYLKNWLGFFDLDKEGSIKAVFSGLQLLTIGFLAGSITYLLSKLQASRPFTILWTLICALFVYLALDDMMMLHERIGFVFNNITRLHGQYESFNWLIYFLPFMAFGAITLILGARSLVLIHNKTLPCLTLGVIGLFLTLFVEILGGQLLQGGETTLYLKTIVLEEALLLFGETFFLYGFALGATALFQKLYIKRDGTTAHLPTLQSLFHVPKITGSGFFIRWGQSTCAHIIRAIVLFIACALVIPLFNPIETLLNTTLPYEAVIRFSLLWVWFGLLIISLPRLAQRGAFPHRVLWMMMAFSFVLLAIIFAGDTHNRVMEEFSWIRYSTSGFLLLSALGAGALSFFEWRKRTRTLSLVWGIFSLGFLFGAIDELFQLHEWIGATVEQVTQLPHIFTDLITVVYAVIALIILILFFTLSWKRSSHTTFPLGIFLTAGATYALSTLFDTLDISATAGLKTIATTLSQNNSFIFRDWFSLLWAPRNFFNSLEEVLEYASAVLFSGAVLLFLVHHTQWHIPQKIEALLFSRTITKKIVLAYSIFTVLALVSGIMIGKKTGISNAQNTTIIAGPKEHLLHADDLFYHPSWGVIIANEGNNSIIRYDHAVLTTIPDPQKHITDTDSVTATDSSIFVSSGATGSIWEYTLQNGWTKLWSRKDGLEFPEALVSVSGTLYAVDESKAAIIQLHKDRKPIEWKPLHPDWITPEGIAYDPFTKKLIVCDDTTGAVFALEFQSSIEKIAQLTRAEDVFVQADGSYLVSDNGTGAIYRIQKNALPEKIIQFSRAYRDLQGIASDGVDIYAITADGYGQMSFMPSFLIKITNL